jgi:hypothetical protein
MLLFMFILVHLLFIILFSLSILILSIHDMMYLCKYELGRMGGGKQE